MRSTLAFNGYGTIHGTNRQERQLALKAILDLNHIPAGMEAFPAIDMDQFEYMKKVIDECDYYLPIIGARYGSTDNVITLADYWRAVRPKEWRGKFLCHGEILKVH